MMTMLFLTLLLGAGIYFAAQTLSSVIPIYGPLSQIVFYVVFTNCVLCRDCALSLELTFEGPEMNAKQPQRANPQPVSRPQAAPQAAPQAKAQAKRRPRPNCCRALPPAPRR